MNDKIVRAAKPAHSPLQNEGAVAKAPPRFIGSEGAAVSPYELLHPMEFDGREYRTVSFSRLKGKHFGKIRLLAAMGVSPDIAMASLITGLPVEVINEMDADDYTEVVERSEPFIPARFREQESGHNSETGQSSQE